MVQYNTVVLYCEEKRLAQEIIEPVGMTPRLSCGQLEGFVIDVKVYETPIPQRAIVLKTVDCCT